MKKFFVFWAAFLICWGFGLRAENLPNAMVQDDKIGLTLNQDFTVTTIEDEEIKIVSLEGIKEYREVVRSYWKDIQKFEVKSASVLYPDGKQKELSPEWVTEETPDEVKNLPLYKDFTLVSLKFPPLVPGAVIKYRIEITNQKPYRKNAFWALSYLEDYSPIQKTGFVLKLPKGIKYNSDVMGEEISPKVEKEDKFTIYFWQLKDRPGLAAENFAPSLSNIAAKITVSSFSSWEEMTAWSYEVISNLTAPDDQAKLKVQKLLNTCKNDQEKLEMLTGFVRAIPTFELPLDRFWEKDFTSSQLLSSAQLTANDKTLLFLILCRAAGLEVYPVLGKSRESTSIDVKAPSPEPFDRLLAGLPGDRYVDFSQKESRAYISILLQGMKGLLLKPNGFGWVTFPEAGAQDNLEELNAQAVLNANGYLEEKFQISAYGNNRDMWVELINKSKQEDLEKLFGYLAEKITPGAHLLEFDPPQILKDRVVFIFTFGVKDFVYPSGKYWVVPLPMLQSLRLSQLLQEGVRRFPVDMQNASLENKEFVLAFPENFKVKSLPEGANLENKVGKYQFITTKEQNRVQVISRLMINSSVIAPQDYPQLKDLIETLNAREKEVILLEKK